jgi:hypothetical protein
MIMGQRPEVPYPVKKYQLRYEDVVNKVIYYSKWLDELNAQERIGWLGHWIRERIKRYDEVINDHLKQVSLN